jgi:hypothetical protein
MQGQMHAVPSGVQEHGAQRGSFLPQLEQAAIAQLQSETIASETDVVADDDEEQGRADFSNLQVLLHSSENFGPVTVRDLTVRFLLRHWSIGSTLL